MADIYSYGTAGNITGVKGSWPHPIYFNVIHLWSALVQKYK